MNIYMDKTIYIFSIKLVVSILIVNIYEIYAYINDILM